jgi:hypothetical protein
MHGSKTLTVAALALGAALLAGGVAQAGTLSYTLDTDFSNDTPLSGFGSLTATFEDTDTDEVTLTLDATNLLPSDTSFVGQWWFNVDESLSADPSAWDFNYVSGPQTSTDPSLNVAMATWQNESGSTYFKPDGDGYFDLTFDWDPGDFASGDVVVYTITADGLTADSFDFLSVGGGDPNKSGLYSAAHIQGLDAGDSAFITGEPGGGEEPPGGGITPTPEPSSLALLAIGALALGFIGRRTVVA